METLNDPIGDRTVKTVKPPPHRPLAYNLMYPDPGNLSINHNLFKFSPPNCTRFGAYQIAFIS